MNDFLNIPPLRKPRQPKKPVVKVQHKYDHRKLYYEARRKMFATQYPEAYAAGEYYDNTYPKVSTTNGFTRYIEDVLNNLGHHAERVNTMGVPMYSGGKPLLDKHGKQRYRYSGSTKGSTDIHCEIRIPSQSLPCGWKIEVKNKDTVLKAQEKYQAKMQRVGVLHTIIHNLDLDAFWDEYYRIIKL